jgi:hypothetical protein
MWAGIAVFILICGIALWNCVDTSPAQITAPLASVTKVFSESATQLSVSATGLTLSYQWFFNGTAIAGAVAPQYSKTWGKADSGTYAVVVTNTYGKDSSSTKLKIISLKDFFLTDQVPSWVPDSASHFAVCSPDSLFTPINGGAPPYIAAGLVSWCFEKMNGGQTASPTGGDFLFLGYVHDYGTTEKAKALYDAKVAANIITKVALGQYTDNEAQASAVAGGVQVYATFGRMFFTFNVTGFANRDDAVAEAIKFLDTYKAIVF